jgi:hypothetical protein
MIILNHAKLYCEISVNDKKVMVRFLDLYLPISIAQALPATSRFALKVAYPVREKREAVERTGNATS